MRYSSTRKWYHKSKIILFFYILIYISLLVLKVLNLLWSITSRNQLLLKYEIKPFVPGINFLFRLYQTWIYVVTYHSSDQSWKLSNQSINTDYNDLKWRLTITPFHL